MASPIKHLYSTLLECYYVIMYGVARSTNYYTLLIVCRIFCDNARATEIEEETAQGFMGNGVYGK